MGKNILITGGAGFIGSHVVRLMVTKYPQYQIFNLDALTYAGNLENLKDIEKAANYHFIKANILEADSLKDIFEKHAITDVIHLAAESHVDRSIVSPLDFVYTNVIGTVNLLNTAKDFFQTHSAEETTTFVENEFEKHPEFQLEYFEIADEATLLPVSEKESNKKYRGFIAIFIENIRLIDNISLN